MLRKNLSAICLVVSLQCTLVCAQPPGAVIAPAGHCWNFTPTYCSYITIPTCMGKVSDDPCDRVGRFCQSTRDSTDETEPELIAGAMFNRSNGYLWKSLGTSVICGYTYNCLWVSMGFDDDGKEILVCTQRDDPNPGYWIENIPDLTVNCVPNQNDGGLDD